MSLNIQNKQDELVPSGEYTAKIVKVSLSRSGETVIFRCAITTDGFNNVVVPGYCAPHWKPSNRTTANLRQWVLNLGVQLVPGHEGDVDLEALAGKDCRIFVQEYTSKTGEQRCKVSNILPFERVARRPVINEAPKTGLHIGASAAPAVQQAAAPVQAEQPAQAAAPKPVQTAAPAEDSDDLW